MRRLLMGLSVAAGRELVSGVFCRATTPRQHTPTSHDLTHTYPRLYKREVVCCSPAISIGREIAPYLAGLAD